MAAGFRDMLVWLLGWKSAYVLTPGPYRVDEAQAACAGAVTGEDYHTGEIIGQDYHTGGIIGQDYHTGGIIGQDYHTGVTAGMCNG